MLVSGKTWLAIALGVAVVLYFYNKTPSLKAALGGA